MTVIPKLLEFYRREGLDISTGLNPVFFDGNAEAPFTYLWQDGKRLNNFGGISLHEILFLELLCDALKPENIYVIGNAFGWSTIALALMNPSAKVIAADPEVEAGRTLTDKIVRQERLNVAVVTGSSPEITPEIIELFPGGELDLVLVDGFHSNECMVQDTAGVMPYLSNNSIVLLHDVIQHNLLAGLKRLEIEYGGDYDLSLLERTPSGMAALMRPTLSSEVKAVIDIYHDPIAGGNNLA